MVVAAMIVIADQLTKWAIIEWVPLYDKIPVNSFINITHQKNPGAAWSFLANAGGWQRWFFVLLGVGVTVMILVWLRKLPAQGQGILAAGLALVASGALGNVVDRVWHGYVVDFISVHYGEWYFPAFNVADIAITVGAGLLILDAVLEFLRNRGEATKSN